MNNFGIDEQSTQHLDQTFERKEDDEYQVTLRDNFLEDAGRKDVRPGPTEDENLKMHAVARVMLHGVLDNIQVSWVKLGPRMAVRMLNCGANDLGGTLMNESISRSSGARHGQEVTPAEMVNLIRAAGQVPFQRNTLYEPLEVFDDHDPADMAPLVERTAAAPLDFLAGGGAVDGSR